MDPFDYGEMGSQTSCSIIMLAYDYNKTLSRHRETRGNGARVFYGNSSRLRTGCLPRLNAVDLPALIQRTLQGRFQRWGYTDRNSSGKFRKNRTSVRSMSRASVYTICDALDIPRA